MALNLERLEAHEVRLFERVGAAAYLKRYLQAQVRARYKFWLPERVRMLTAQRSAIGERILLEHGVFIPEPPFPGVRGLTPVPQKSAA